MDSDEAGLCLSLVLIFVSVDHNSKELSACTFMGTTYSGTGEVQLLLQQLLTCMESDSIVTLIAMAIDRTMHLV